MAAHIQFDTTRSERDNNENDAVVLSAALVAYRDTLTEKARGNLRDYFDPVLAVSPSLARWFGHCARENVAARRRVDRLLAQLET